MMKALPAIAFTLYLLAVPWGIFGAVVSARDAWGEDFGGFLVAVGGIGVLFGAGGILFLIVVLALMDFDPGRKVN
jgi:hypothetical protein